MRVVVFLALLLGAIGLFASTVARILKLVRQGRAEMRLDRIGERVLSLLVYFFGQRKVPEPVSYDRRPGVTSLHHLGIFYGFLIITIGTVELVLSALTGGGFDFSFIGDTAYRVLKLTIDWSCLVVLAMVLFAFVRRAIIRVRMIPLSRDAAIILLLIAGLMVTHYGYYGLEFVAAGHAAPWAESGSVSGALAAHLGAYLAPRTAAYLSETSFWLHVLILFGFLNYLPYSKHIHILTAGPNIFLRNLGQRGVLPLLDLEAEDLTKTGVVDTYRDFTWKSLFDTFSCTECARCSNFCPAYNTDKPLSPMHLIHDIHDEVLERGGLLDEIAVLERQIAAAGSPAAHAHGESTAGHAHSDGEDHGHDDAAHPNGHASALLTPEDRLGSLRQRLAELPPLVGGRVREETLWACTTCGACQEVCPVFIDHPEKIIQMRQNLVMLQEKAPAELARTYKNLERQGNPWGIAPEKRMEWAEGLDVKTIEQNPNAEYLLWIGCAGAFDERIRKSTRALVEVLQSAQVDFAVLGEDEECSGDPARRTGNEMLYQEQAKVNVETLNSAKVRKVITACPHCLHTIKNEYPQLGGHFEVYHHTQILRELMDAKRIHLEQPVAQSITYHEPCYLGRWNGEYTAAREILGQTPTPGGFLELDRIKERSFCCGAGGGGMWMEEKSGKRVNLERVDEILAKPVDAVAVACPFCTIMVEDGLKHRNAEERVQVLDVAQVIRKSMVRVHKGVPVPEPPQASEDSADPAA